MSEEREYSSEENILVPLGYKAIVRYVKLEATCLEVCEKLLALNRETARSGDVKDLQDLARVAIELESMKELKHDRLRKEDGQRAESDSQGFGGDQSRDSAIES